MRFLHLADVHLDTPFQGRSSELRERLRAASREALRRAVDLAVEERLDAVLLAGDLFDGERLSFATERFLLAQLERLSEEGILTVYATGNHDPGGGAVRSSSLRWPDGVHVISSADPVRVRVRGPGGAPVGTVTVAGHETAHETRDLVARFPEPEGGSIPHVGLVHAQVVGARGEEGHEPYAPTERDALGRSGYGYWALGHVHVRQKVMDDPSAWYPGNLQGRNPRETGAKGGLLVEMEEGGAPSVEFRALAPIRWERLDVDGLEEVETLDGLVRVVEERWDEERRGDPGLPGADWILRVALAGPSPLHRALGRPDDRSTLEEELAARLGVLEAEVRAGSLHPPVDVAEHLERQDVLGEALRLLEDAREGDDVLDEIVPDALAGRPPSSELHAYVRSLLEGLEAELITRMLDPGRSDDR